MYALDRPDAAVRFVVSLMARTPLACLSHLHLCLFGFLALRFHMCLIFLWGRAHGRREGASPAPIFLGALLIVASRLPHGFRVAPPAAQVNDDDVAHAIAVTREYFAE